MNTGKKPPMEIGEEEIEETQDRGPKPGGLTYGRRVVRRDSEINGGPKFSLTTAVVGAFLGFVFAAGMVTFFSASKADVQLLNTQLSSIKESQVKTESTIALDSRKISDLSAALGTYATKTDLGTYATKADLAGIRLDGYALKSSIPDVTPYDTKTSVDAKIKALQDQITLLKDPISTSTGGVVTPGLVKATFSTSNWVPTYYTPTAAKPTFQLPFKLTITNELARPISNLQLYVSMYASGSSAGSATLQSLSAGGGTWSTYTTSGNSFYFTNSNSMSSWGGSSLTIAAKAQATINLLFSYTAPPDSYGTSISFSPDIATISAGDYTVN